MPVQRLNEIIRLLSEVSIYSGLGVGDLYPQIESEFVIAASKVLTNKAGKPNNSQISAATGITRSSVRRILRDTKLPNELRNLGPINKARKVLAEIRRQQKRPSSKRAILPYSRGANSLRKVILSVAGDVTPSAVLKEMKRLGMLAALKAKRDSVTVNLKPATPLLALKHNQAIGIVRALANGRDGNSERHSNTLFKSLEVLTDKEAALIARDVELKAQVLMDSIGISAKTSRQSSTKKQVSTLNVAISFWHDS
jgi:hypothetical protein